MADADRARPSVSASPEFTEHARCPQGPQLLAFLLGKLSYRDSETIALHLEDCDRCTRQLDSFDDSGDMVVRILRDSGLTTNCLDEHEVQVLYERVGKIALASGSGSQAVGRDALLHVAVPEVPGELAEYRILEKLGQGGMGVVYKAEHLHLRKTVVVKFILPRRASDANWVARFFGEIRAVGQLDHPNVVRATDARQVGGLHFLVMEYVDGVDVSCLLCAKKRLSVANACEIARQTAKGLAYIHRFALVHRDVKPSNLIVSRNGIVKILDLGLAKLKEGSSAVEKVPDADYVVGTLDYLSPEQASDTRAADARSDLYGLGCTLYRMLAGQVPFPSDRYPTPEAKLRAHRFEPARGLAELCPDAPPGLTRIVMKLLAKEPEERFRDSSELAKALAGYCGGSNLPRVAAALAGPATATQATDLDSYLGGTTQTLPKPLAPRRRRILRGVFRGMGYASLVLFSSLTIMTLFPTREGVPVEIATKPPGAEVTFIPLDPTTGVPKPADAVFAGKSQIVHARLAAGRYLVVAVLDESRFQEVFRTVPSSEATGRQGPFDHLFWQRRDDGGILLPAIVVPPDTITAGMTFFPGSSSVTAAIETDSGVRSTRLALPPFFADSRKVNRQIFESEIGIERLPVRFRTRPAAERAAFDEGDAPLTNVSWDEAVHLAERAGKRILDEFEFEFAARSFQKSAQPHDWLRPPAEWTNSWAVSYPTGPSGQVLSSSLEDRVVRGVQHEPALGPSGEDFESLVSSRVFLDRRQATSLIGFRLGRSAKPRLRPEDFCHPVEAP